MTNPPPETAVPSVATCLRCGKQYDPAAEGDALFCGSCAAAQARVSVTTVLIVLNVLVFVAMALGGVSPLAPTGQQLVDWGASYGPYELGAEWWRVFTAMFVHIGLIHIGLNMLCLSNLGPLTERTLGWRTFLVLYVLSGVGGNVASVGLRPTIVAAGASGAIFGVAGALLAILQVRKIPALASLRGRMSKTGIGGFIAYNLVFGFASTGIDNAAHIGGLLIGFLIGLLIPIADSSRIAVRRTQGVLLATAIVVAGAFVGVRQLHRSLGEVEAARRQILSGDATGGTARLERIVRDQPHNVEARALLGAAYLDENRPGDAIRELEIAVQEDSTNSFALGSLGGAHWALQQWGPAVEAYRRQTRADPANAGAWANLGGAYLNGGHPDDAIPALEQATKLDAETASYHYNLGLAYVQARRYPQAVAAFNRALRFEPDNALGLLQRGRAYDLQGKRDSARADYQRVVDAPEGAVAPDTRRQARSLLAELERH